MRRSRFRIAILVALGIWLALLAVGFVGKSVGAPDVVVNGAALLWAAMGLFIVPSSWLVSLRLEEGMGPGSIRASHMGPYSLVTGSLAFVVGILLLLPSSSATPALRIGGAWAAGWGGFVVFVGVTALRKKRRTRVGTRV